MANVVSVGFKHLCKTDLEESESKEFAAKNIFLNIHSIIRETIKAITEHIDLTALLGKESIEEMKFDLIV